MSSSIKLQAITSSKYYLKGMKDMAVAERHATEIVKSIVETMLCSRDAMSSKLTCRNGDETFSGIDSNHINKR